MKKISGRLICVSASAIGVLLVLQACSSSHPPPERSQPSTEAVAPNPPPPAPETHRLPTRAPASVAIPTDDDKLEASLKQLRAGNLAYSTPPKMKTGQTGQVTARIATASLPTSELTRDLPGGQTSVVGPVKVSTKMKMTLSGPDFTITALSPIEQFVDNESPTQWQWDIKPNKAGKLHLRLAAIVELNELSKEFKTVDREIAVQVDPVDEASEFWKGNWQWIIATLTALGGAIWKWLASRKKTVSVAKSS